MGVVRFSIGVLIFGMICKRSYSLFEHNPFLSKVTVPPTATNAINPNTVINQENTSLLPLTTNHHNNLPSLGTILTSVPTYLFQTSISSVIPAVTQPPISTQPLNHPPQTKQDDYVRGRCQTLRGQFPSLKCNKFVNCWDGLAIEQFCPVGLAFNPAGYCDHIYNVDCRGKQFEAHPALESISLPAVLEKETGQHQVNTGLPTQSPAVNSKPSTNTPVANFQDKKLKKHCLTSKGLFPSLFCNKYVNCWDGFVVEQDCPQGLLFSYKGYCDYDYNVNCNGRLLVETIEQTTANSITSQQPIAVIQTAAPLPSSADENLKKCAGLKGQFPTNACNKYLECWDSIAIERECPPGLLFSQKGYCDFDYNVDCNKRTVNKPIVDSSCPVPNGTFRDQYNCSCYYTCTQNTVLSKYECPAGLRFNEVTGVCDFAYRVDCTRKPFSYEPSSKPDHKPSGIMELTSNCRPGQVFKLNTDCSSAALCRNSVIEVVHCLTGMSYDALSDRCLPAQMARCQDI